MSDVGIPRTQAALDHLTLALEQKATDLDQAGLFDSREEVAEFEAVHARAKFILGGLERAIIFLARYQRAAEKAPKLIAGRSTAEGKADVRRDVESNAMLLSLIFNLSRKDVEKLIKAKREELDAENGNDDG